jgi:peptide/nickel transport system ATP-binding protein
MNEVAEALGEERGQTLARLEKIFGRLGLEMRVLGKYAHELSGGQARRVAVARALLMQPRILIADEPTAGLDVSVQGDLLNLLQELRRTMGITIVVISHNLAVIRLVADVAAVMRNGSIVEAGPAHQVFDSPSADYTRRLIASWPQARKPAEARSRAAL